MKMRSGAPGLLLAWFVGLGFVLPGCGDDGTDITPPSGGQDVTSPPLESPTPGEGTGTPPQTTEPPDVTASPTDSPTPVDVSPSPTGDPSTPDVVSPTPFGDTPTQVPESPTLPPDVTPTPDSTLPPDVTPTPDSTLPPDVTPTPDSTLPPDVTPTPDSTLPPDVTPTVAPTPTLPPDVTPTVAPTPTLPPDVTPTLAPTPTLPPDVTPTLEPTPTLPPDVTPTLEPTPTLPPDVTPTLEPTPTLAPTPTLEPTPTPETDADGDGYSAATDCDDTNPDIHPDSTVSECDDLVDYNCDGYVGTLLLDGDVLDVPLDTVSVTLNVTIAGKTVSSSNASATDYGAIRVRNVVTGETFKLGDLWNVTTNLPSGTVKNRLLPGIYDILYSVVDDGPLSPDNQDALLKSAVDLSGDLSLAVDIPVITVSFSTTLAGASLSTSNTSSTDYGQFSLRDTTTDEVFPLYDTYDSANRLVRSTYSARLVPGTYDVLYSAGQDGSSWPAGSSELIETGLTLSTSTSHTINVPVTNLSISLTLNGASISSSNTNNNDYGRIELVNSAGKSYRFFNTWNSTTSTAVGSFTGGVIPGTYSIQYSSQKTGGNWPANENWLLQSAVNTSSTKSLSLNLTAIDLTVSAKLNNTTLSTSNTSATDYGQIRLRGSNGDTFKVFDTFNTTTNTVVSSGKARLFPGTYDVVYATKKAGTRWPINPEAQLSAGISVTSSTSTAVNISTVTITCGLTLDGATVSSSNTSADDYGKLVLSRALYGERFKLCGAWNNTTSTPVTSTSAVIIPGTYDVLYDAEKDGPHWPGNQDLYHSTQSLSSTRSLTLNVPVRELTLALELDGSLPSTSNTSATDSGLLELWNLEADADSWTAWTAWDATTGTLNSDDALQLEPGIYAYVYSSDPDGGHWPANQNEVLGCFTIE
jgi:hypothetical protein